MCKCCLCGSRTHTLTDWERHAGSKARKWRYSVKVESTMQPLKEWVCTSPCYIRCMTNLSGELYVFYFLFFVLTVVKNFTHLDYFSAV